MASKAFEAGVRSIFAPRLEALGFTRKGVRYARPGPFALVQAIKLEQDKYNGSGVGRFRIVLARRIAATRADRVDRALAMKHLFDTPSPELGPLSDVRQGYDYVYLPDDPATIDTALNEALSDIERYGMFWLRWGFARPFRGRDKSRADAADARWRAFVGGLQPQTGPE